MFYIVRDGLPKVVSYIVVAKDWAGARFVEVLGIRTLWLLAIIICSSRAQVVFSWGSWRSVFEGEG